MPALPKTSDERIISAARKLVERHGATALSMQAVADKVGVRAPSLYKRFADREAILDAVLLAAAADLTAAISAVVDAEATRPADLVEMAWAYRRFALRSPHLYQLLFANRADPPQAMEARVQALAPVLSRLALLVPEAQILPAARLLVAFLHGFVSMELNAAFHLGGSLDEAFSFGVESILGAFQAPQARRSSRSSDAGPPPRATMKRNKKQ